MSQMTFDGFVEPPYAEASGGKPEKTPPRAETWYKGRVLSHSSVNLYKTCPQRWRFRYIDKVPEKPRSFFSFGKSVHTGLEYLFSATPGTWPTLDDVLAHYKTTWLREGYETPAQEKWFFQEGERILRGFYAKHQKEKSQVFQVEQKFTIDVEGVPVTGFIDRIDTTPKGNLAIVDYKTGKAFDKSRVRNDPQLTLYQMAVRETFGKEVETVSLYHLNSLTPLTVPAHSKKQEGDVKAAVVEAAKGINELKFDPTPNERGHCQYCDYIQICPAFTGKRFAIKAPVKTTVAELADRYGKIDNRIRELTIEREEVEEELVSQMKVTEKTELQGEHYNVKLTNAEDPEAPQLEAKLIKDDTPQ